MRVVLRLIAVWLLFYILIPFFLLAWHGIDLVRSGSLPAWPRVLQGVAVVSVLLALIGLAAIAARGLWHYQELGRRLAILVFGIVVAMFMATLLFDREMPLGALLCPLAPMLVLLSPPARQACR